MKAETKSGIRYGIIFSLSFAILNYISAKVIGMITGAKISDETYLLMQFPNGLILVAIQIGYKILYEKKEINRINT